MIWFSSSIPFTSYFSIISSGLTDGERPCDVGELGFHRQVPLDVLRVALCLEGQGRARIAGGGEVIGTGLGGRVGRVDEGGVHAELEVHRVVLGSLSRVGHDVERGLLRDIDVGDVDGEVGAVDDLQCARGRGGEHAVSAHGERDDRRHRHRQVGIVNLVHEGDGLGGRGAGIHGSHYGSRVRGYRLKGVICDAGGVTSHSSPRRRPSPMTHGSLRMFPSSSTQTALTICRFA